jgi:hypothetical protein
MQTLKWAKGQKERVKRVGQKPHTATPRSLAQVLRGARTTSHGGVELD